MYQQTYCHTLPKPFSKIFLFRIYVPTTHSVDVDFDETSDRLTHISAPIQPPQTNPPTTLPTHHRYRNHTHTTNSTQPQIPHPTNTHTRTASTNTQPPQTHRHTQTHSTQARPPTLSTHSTLTPTRRRCCSTGAVAESAIGQARQTGSD